MAYICGAINVEYDAKSLLPIKHVCKPTKKLKV